MCCACDVVLWMSCGHSLLLRKFYWESQSCSYCNYSIGDGQSGNLTVNGSTRISRTIIAKMNIFKSSVRNWQSPDYRLDASQKRIQKAPKMDFSCSHKCSTPPTGEYTQACCILAAFTGGNVTICATDNSNFDISVKAEKDVILFVRCKWHTTHDVCACIVDHSTSLTRNSNKSIIFWFASLVNVHEHG